LIKLNYVLLSEKIKGKKAGLDLSRDIIYVDKISVGQMYKLHKHQIPH